MDGRMHQLQEEFEQASRRTAELKVQLDLASGKVPDTGIPHDILVEQAAREVGALVSRIAQQIHLQELTARHLGHARCPECGHRGKLTGTQRSVTSIDTRPGHPLTTRPKSSKALPKSNQ